MTALRDALQSSTVLFGLLIGAATLAPIAPPARAQIAVIDISSIVEEIQIIYNQVKSFLQDIQAYLLQYQQYFTEVKELAEDIQTVANLVMLADNFVHNPSLGAAMGLLAVAGINLDLPVNPMAIQGLISGYGGMMSVNALVGKVSGLGSLINTSYTNDHLYSCGTQDFACTQTQANANGLAGLKGTLSKLFDSLSSHNDALAGLQTRADTATDPKTAMDVTDQGVIQVGWSVNQLTQATIAIGLNQAQRDVVSQQRGERYQKDIDNLVAAVPK